MRWFGLPGIGDWRGASLIELVAGSFGSGSCRFSSQKIAAGGPRYGGDGALVRIAGVWVGYRGSPGSAALCLEPQPPAQRSLRGYAGLCPDLLKGLCPLRISAKGPEVLWNLPFAAAFRPTSVPQTKTSGPRIYGARGRASNQRSFRNAPQDLGPIIYGPQVRRPSAAADGRPHCGLLDGD